MGQCANNFEKLRQALDEAQRRETLEKKIQHREKKELFSKQHVCDLETTNTAQKKTIKNLRGELKTLEVRMVSVEQALVKANTTLLEKQQHGLEGSVVKLPKSARRLSLGAVGGQASASASKKGAPAEVSKKGSTPTGTTTSISCSNVGGSAGNGGSGGAGGALGGGGVEEDSCGGAGGGVKTLHRAVQTDSRTEEGGDGPGEDRVCPGDDPRVSSSGRSERDSGALISSSSLELLEASCEELPETGKTPISKSAKRRRKKNRRESLGGGSANPPGSVCSDGEDGVVSGFSGANGSCTTGGGTKTRRPEIADQDFSAQEGGGSPPPKKTGRSGALTRCWEFVATQIRSFGLPALGVAGFLLLCAWPAAGPAGGDQGAPGAGGGGVAAHH